MKEDDMVWVRNPLAPSLEKVLAVSVRRSSVTATSPKEQGVVEVWFSATISSMTINADGSSNVVTTTKATGEVFEFNVPAGKDEIDEIKMRNADDTAPGVDKKYDDLVNLPFLNEPEILYHVKERYAKSIVYTHTGPVLIAVNPLVIVTPTSRSNEIMALYAKKLKNNASLSGLVNDHTEGDAAVFVPKESEIVPGGSVLVSGESGSGKTECSKMLVGCLLEGTNDPTIMQNIVNANDILEAFGNAKTTYSNNSSRYGKFLDLFYGSDGNPVGGAIRTYLIETVRVVNQMKGERNFHVFYQLVSGATETEQEEWRLQGMDVESFPYLTKGKVSGGTTVGDANKFDLLRKSFLQLEGMDTTTVDLIFRLIMGVLHMGRIEYNAVDMGTDGIVSEMKDMKVVETAAALCGFSTAALAQILTERTFVSPRGEKFVTKLTPEQSINGRDAIAKAVFGRVFSWIVEKINTVIAPPNSSQKSYSISILDIYGFDAFSDNNSFEQLCINYVNEALQQQFNQQIFKMEIAEYESEAISMQAINFADNQDSLDLIGQGIFKLIDDQCKIPKASDQRLAQQMYKDFGEMTNTAVSKINPASASAKLSMSKKFTASKTHQVQNKFVVWHYAGPVVYVATSFIEKNMDELPSDAGELIKRSTNAILSSSKDKAGEIAGLVEKLQINPQRRSVVMAASSGAATTPTRVLAGGSRSPVPGAIGAGTTPNRSKATGPSSAVTQFKNELAVLIKQINATTPHYIRCIKPIRSTADYHVDSKFDEICVAEQLQYSGVLQAVSVNRAGLPVKIGCFDFFCRYSSLATSTEAKHFTAELDELDDKPEELKAYCETLVNSIYTAVNVDTNPAMGIGPADLQLGLTKMFLKKRTLELLEGRRSTKLLGGKREEAAVVIQSEYRGYLSRKNNSQRRFRPMSTVVKKVSTVPSPVDVTDNDNHFPQVVPLSLPDTPVNRVASTDTVTTDSGGLAESPRISQYLASKVSEFNKQDVALLKSINNIITVSKANDQVAIISLDVDNSKHLLDEWARTSSPGIFQLKMEEVNKLIDYGYKLLKSEKLIPKSVTTKLFSMGKRPSLSMDERQKNAKTANKMITKEHKLFKGIYIAVEQIRELRATATLEQTNFMKRMHRKEDEYKQASNAPTATENHKLTLKNLHEQENTKLIRQIQCAKKVIDICISLEQYFLKYVTAFVDEFGINSEYKKSFAHEELYILALTELIEAQKPLLAAEKKALETGAKKVLAKTSQELFPLTLPVGDAYRMSMINHLNLNFNYMPFLPGEEFTLNSLNMLFSGRSSMHPIRFIKVMGRSKNNDGKTAYYQTSPCLTQSNIQNVVDKDLISSINKDSFSSMVLVSILCGLTDAPPESFMVNMEDTQNVKIVGCQNDRIFSAGGLIFKKDGVAQFDSPEMVGSTCNTLFLLPQMDEALSTLLFDHILRPKCSPEDIVSSWMRELYMQNQRYQSLITSGFNGLDLDTLQLPVKLPTDTVVAIYKKLVAIHELLADKDVSAMTHHDLFAHFYPNQANYYSEKRILMQTTPLKDMISTLMAPVKAKEVDPEFISAKNKGSAIVTMEALSLEFVSSINFNRLVKIPPPEDPKKPNICSIIKDNLAFLPMLRLEGISEAQLRDMFLTSSTKSNTKEVILLKADQGEAKGIKESTDISTLMSKHGAHITFL
jgi:myosin-5